MIELKTIQPIGAATPPSAEEPMPLLPNPAAVSPDVVRQFLKNMGEDAAPTAKPCGTLTELLAQLMRHNDDVRPV